MLISNKIHYFRNFAVRSINYVLKGCCAECAVELKKDH